MGLIPSFVIHMLWNVEAEANMEPPLQIEWFRSGGEIISTGVELGAKALISL
jgi:hypothetical protein